MDESPTDVVQDITPEEFEGTETPKVESSPAKPEASVEAPKVEAPAEDKKPEVVEKPTVPEIPEIKEKEAPKETEGEVKPDEAVKPEEPQKGLEKRTAQLNTEIRDLVAQRNALKAEVAKANEVYQPATEQELVDDGMSATEAKVEALRQEIEIRDYNEKVADAQLTINSEANRVLTDFPMFNSDNENYDKELAEEAAALLQSNLILDPNTNQVIGSHVSPYQLYKTLARASGISGAKGQIKGQQATEQMLANADAGGTASPPKKAVDPVMALWEDPL